MEKRIEELIRYLDAAHSVFHAVAELAQRLEVQGYERLHESGSWELSPGGKYYLTRGGSALTAFRVPTAAPKGFMFTASHSDRPCFKVKNGELTGNYTRLSVEPYGGMVISTWLDRPLSVAGRVLVETEEGISPRLVDIDRDLLLIPNVAIHMNRKINDGYSWNPAVDTLPLLGGKDAAGKFWQAVEQAAGGKVLGHDLYLYSRQKPFLWGMEEEYLSAPALDDLTCVWSCCQGFLRAAESASIPVLCVFDNEEVGSSSLQGAASDFLSATVSRICAALSLEEKPLLANSMMVSADNGHALHPNHPEYADPANAPVLGKGPVLKFTATQRYTTDGISSALLRRICRDTGVELQVYCNRADIPGGSTLGNISLSQVAVPSVDMGLPQLAMHSSCETVAVRDVLTMEDAMTAFYSTSLEQPQDGCYILK